MRRTKELCQRLDRKDGFQGSKLGFVFLGGGVSSFEDTRSFGMAEGLRLLNPMCANETRLE